MKNSVLFTVSYSSGKDSTLALWKAVQAGFTPLRLLMMNNTDHRHAWFHDLSPAVAERLSDALGIPIHLIDTTGDTYERDLEAALIACRQEGAEMCVFGDIDIEGHYAWGCARCGKAELRPWYPLWHMKRRDVVLSFLEAGFTTVITAVDLSKLDVDYLGKPLTRELMAQMEAEGIDPCGENGEYHSLVVDGPLFRHPLEYRFGEPVMEFGFVKLPVL